VKRTRGITFLSLTFFALGFLLVTMSVWGLRNLVSWSLLQLFDAILLAAFLAAGLMCTAAAVGLLQLRNWGRQIIVMFSLLMIITGIAGIIISPDQLSSISSLFTILPHEFPHFNTVGGAMATLLGLIALWYLSKPRVKFLFWW